MEKESTYILYVKDVARMLGKTEACIRAACFRGSDSIPKWFHIGKRIVWDKSEVDLFIEKNKKNMYVPDMAKLMRKSEAAIRAAVFRGSESIPKPFKLSQKWAWVEADALKFIEEKRKESKK